MCVRACVRERVYTGSRSRLPKLLWLRSGTETPRERQRRERGGRNGGREGSGRGRPWEMRELFSALSHQTPTASEGVAAPPARSTVNLQRNEPRSPPLPDPSAPPRLPGGSLGAFGYECLEAKEEPAGEKKRSQISHEPHQRIWRIVCKLK